MAHRIQWAQRANLFESLAVSFTWFVEIFGRDGQILVAFHALVVILTLHQAASLCLLSQRSFHFDAMTLVQADHSIAHTPVLFADFKYGGSRMYVSPY
jgi:hypothetical protein